MKSASPVVYLLRAIIAATASVGIHGISNKSWHGWTGRRQARAKALRTLNTSILVERMRK